MGNLHEFGVVNLVEKPSAEPLDRLTPRQLEVLAMLCEGLPNKLIARRLNISNGTVKVHIVHILRVFKVSSRLQAVLVARQLGFVAKIGHLDGLPPPTLAVPTRVQPIAMRLKVAPEETPLPLIRAMSKRLGVTAG